MPAYPNPPAANNPTDEFNLTAPTRRTRKDLDSWVSRALAKIQPWTWSLAARIARTWKGNPNHDAGQHAKERWSRERRLAANLVRLQKIKGGMLATRLPGRLHASALALSHQAARLLHGGDWWMDRARVDHATGELIERPYLPEDTWSAESAFDYAVSLLARLVAAAWGMTEKTTPRYRPENPARASGRSNSAVEGITTADLARLAAKFGAGGQRELPATS